MLANINSLQTKESWKYLYCYIILTTVAMLKVFDCQHNPNPLLEKLDNNRHCDTCGFSRRGFGLYWQSKTFNMASGLPLIILRVCSQSNSPSKEIKKKSAALWEAEVG